MTIAVFVLFSGFVGIYKVRNVGQNKGLRPNMRGRQHFTTFLEVTTARKMVEAEKKTPAGTPTDEPEC